MRPDFADFYDEHIWNVYGFFAYRVQSRADAEDLTQQAFERALRAWARFDPRRSEPGTWLMAIARNLLIDHYRQGAARRHDAVGNNIEAEQASGEPEYSIGVAPELARALAGLSEREREVVALRFGGDLNGREVAALLGLTVANVQQISSRALRKLRTALEPNDGGTDGARGSGGQRA